MNAIADIYFNKAFIAACKKFSREWEDLRSETIIQLLKIPIIKIEEIISKNRLLRYSIQIAKFQASVNRSDFNRTNKGKIDLVFSPEVEDGGFLPDFCELDEDKQQAVLDKIEQDCNSQDHFYHARIFMLYNQNNTYKLEKELQIGRNELYNTAKKYRKYLNEWIQSLTA